MLFLSGSHYLVFPLPAASTASHSDR
uniref:Uncharacterized protein n=1 Tax=Anguilla anguilla TaxID=7936 RepID=A0A0E9VR80_ANGAN